MKGVKSLAGRSLMSIADLRFVDSQTSDTPPAYQQELFLWLLILDAERIKSRSNGATGRIIVLREVSRIVCDSCDTSPCEVAFIFRNFMVVVRSSRRRVTKSIICREGLMFPLEYVRRRRL